MAHYLVTARPRGNIGDLERLLRKEALLELEPFGKAITESLTGARLLGDGRAVWEEVDYCVPPLAAECAAVLDRFFDEIAVKIVRKGDGWKQIAALPPLFPTFAAN